MVLVRKLLLPVALLLSLLAAATVASAGPAPVVSTDRACYLLGQYIAITGAGFAPSTPVAATVDRVNFGMTTTDANGGFTTRGRPEEIFGHTIAQSLFTLLVTDGTSTASTTFTVTRSTGARLVGATGRTLATYRARFQVWGLALTKGPPPIYPAPLTVFVHYVGPHGGLRKTISLGRAGGQCGYMKTRPVRVFPFSPIPGNWTLQVDASRAYVRHPPGAVAHIRLLVR